MIAQIQIKLVAMPILESGRYDIRGAEYRIAGIFKEINSENL